MVLMTHCHYHVYVQFCINGLIHEIVQTDAFCVVEAVLFLCCGFLEAVGCMEEGEGYTVEEIGLVSHT